MNLATLRRVVWAVDAAAVLAAGGAAWFAVEGDATARDDKAWKDLFAVKRADASAELIHLPPKEEFSVAASWAQGDKPVKPVDTGPAPPPPPPDPLQGVTLRSVSLSSMGMLHCTASFQKDGFPFTLFVGERIPVTPNDPDSPPGPWRMDAVRRIGPDTGPATGAFAAEAVFHHLEDGREAVKSMDASTSASLLPGSPDGGPGEDPIFRKRDAEGRPDRLQPPRMAQIRADAAAGVYEIEIPESEVEWLEAWSGEEAKNIAAVATRDEAGNPNGFQLKSVAKGSRLEAAGFKAEDRVISVNSEKVSTTEQAIAVGKRQYEAGSSTFAVKFVRGGREMSFTFHAPKKKAKK
jgi:hypothetical protein